jgi:hypothetical protein
VIGRPWLADLTLNSLSGELTAWLLTLCLTLQNLTLKSCTFGFIDASYNADSCTLGLQDLYNPTEIASFI